MKNKYLIIILSFSFFSISQSVNAQLHLSLGPAIGYTIPSGDYGGNPSDFYTGSKYGLSGGIDFGAMGKLGLGPINFRVSLIYTPLSNNGVADVTHSGSSVQIKQQLFTIGVGTQYGFGVPLAPIKPYIGFDLLFTSISGSAQFQGTQDIPSSLINMNIATRTGLGLAVGAEIKLLTFSLDLSLRYNFVNLFSKRYEGSATGDRIQSYLYLNDEKDPNYSPSDPKHPIGNNRTITTLQFQLGVMFGI